MALIKTGPNYTSTGDKNGIGGTLMRISNFFTYVPLPIIAPALTSAFGILATAVDTLKWTFRLKLGSAATALASGTVNTSLNTLSATGGIASPVYWANLASGVFTGNTIGTHGRALTETAIGALGRPLGIRPMVLSSHQAGIGAIGGASMPAGPGYYATRAAQERGQDPNAMWANYRNGAGAQHVAELEAARARGYNAQRAV